MHCANVPKNSTCIPVNAVHYMILSSAYFVANDALHYMIADIWAHYCQYVIDIYIPTIVKSTIERELFK